MGRDARAPFSLAISSVPSLLPESTTIRSSQNATLSSNPRYSPPRFW
jgi:hypothetical protein